MIIAKQEEFGLRFLEFLLPMDGHGIISKKLLMFGEELVVWANLLQELTPLIQ